MEDHVFLSYTRSDEAYAGKLAMHLRAQGVEVWTDAAIAFGADWMEAIKEKIDSCVAFIVVMSPAAQQSKWVRREVLYAEAQGKQIFPLLLSGAPIFGINDLLYEDVKGGSMPSPRWVGHLHERRADR